MEYPIYLDYNATTPVDPEVLKVMIPYFSTLYGNASSRSHPYGWVAEQAVELARDQLSSLIGARSKEVIFTSGATEAINLGIKGVFEHYKGEEQHYISCVTEHKAVLDTLESIRLKGASVTILPVKSNGDIDLDLLESNITPKTKMICLMWANNETGVIHPIDKLIKIAEKYQIIFFTDAVQAVGKIPVDVKGVHLLALSGHKFYAPKGVGALFIRHNHHLPKPIAMIEGGGQEKNFRSGTLNVPGIVGLGAAAELASQVMYEESERLIKLRDYLEMRLTAIQGTVLNGSQTLRLPHVSNVTFEGVEGDEFLRAVNQHVAVSSGSACTSISPKPSHVLAAMGIESELGRSSLRFSLGRMTTKEEIDQVVKNVIDTYHSLLL
ncbi:cysteine desulfurase family protein [Belliella kenyensis]|uniref:cysteine desulfurase n=1 Tax=Belliella kenyensis TaxID=1472724 RepID=A0ABV8EIL8_9BACT|nr:cysteine desulfurase family protein [Belliella kenyensis]MCH7400254.1 cysteine desulfurase [Belliella kenyensis]MDN3604729.1 cysteine desulfurase family protein [Belliella kenyensis]